MKEQIKSIDQYEITAAGQMSRVPNIEVLPDIGVIGYEGFRIQIDGKVFPNNLIARGSYKMIPASKRKISEFSDANGKKHVRYYPRTGVEIQFKIRKRNMEEQTEVASFFSEKDIYDLVYWDDSVMDYRTGDFRITSDIYFQHDSIKKRKIRYGETEIKFERV